MPRLKIRTKERQGREALANPKSRNGTMGISLGNRYFSKENVEAYMRFGLDNFKHFLVWVADYPERWNFMALRGMSEEEATEKALKVGSELKKSYQRVVDKLSRESVDVSRVEISDYLGLVNPDYEQALQTIQEYDAKDKEFNGDLRRWVMNNIGSRFRERGLKGSKLENAVETASNYLKEEMAMMVHLAEKHPCRFIDVYPVRYKSMICLKGLNEGKYPELSDALELQDGYGFIDATIKKPMMKTISEKIARMKGKDPDERRNYEKRVHSGLDNAVGIGSLVLATLLMFGPFIATDLATRKDTTRVYVGQGSYLVITRNNGLIEVHPSHAMNERWIDRDNDKHLDEVVIEHGRFPPIRLRAGPRFEGAENIYQKIQSNKPTSSK